MKTLNTKVNPKEVAIVERKKTTTVHDKIMTPVLPKNTDDDLRLRLFEKIHG